MRHIMTFCLIKIITETLNENLMGLWKELGLRGVLTLYVTMRTLQEEFFAYNKALWF